MTATAGRRHRDARLDLARGMTMLFIFVAHVPDNALADYIPAKFGFSSGAEAFVLCSGIACGLAFGGAYRRDGWAAGTRRIARRITQLWLAQTIAFALFAGLLLAIDRAAGTATYAQRYDLAFVEAAPAAALLAVATLRVVPLYFDILPLYILLLAAVPAAMFVHSRAPGLPLAISAGLWALSQVYPLHLQAAPGRSWYFNPLAWQFLFFIGYGASSGWFRLPPARPWLVATAALFVAACVPLTFWGAHAAFPILDDIYRAIYPADAITLLHPLRLLHVLALGWLFAAALAAWTAPPALRAVLLVGRQSLSTFLAGVFASAAGGIALDVIGRGGFATAMVNAAGCLALIGVAAAAQAVKAGQRPLGARIAVQ